HATGLCSRSAITRAGDDQAALELGETAEYGHHQPTVWRRGIGPKVSERLEVRASLAELVEDVEQISHAACEPIEPRHHQHVAFLEFANQLGQLGAIRFRAARFLEVDFGRTGGVELRIPAGERLAVRAHPRVAVNRHFWFSTF